MAEESSRRRLTREDTAVLRALAHPVRIRLLQVLAETGPAMVSTVAGRVDEPVPVVSYHLGQLARFGLVARAPELARDRRERWWRFVPTEELSFARSEFTGDPAGQAAVAALEHQWLAVVGERIARWIDEAPRWPREWQDAAVTSAAPPLRLTAAELARFLQEYHDLVARWAEHGRRAEARGEKDGRETVFVLVHASPGRTDT